MLDWHLPGMTTVEILSALRFGGGGAKRPFILYCTADNDPIELTRAFAAGIDAYIMKPFDRQSFAEKFTEIRSWRRSAARPRCSQRAGI